MRVIVVQNPTFGKIQDGGDRHLVNTQTSISWPITDRHLEFPINSILGPQWPSYGQCEAAHQIWCKLAKKWQR